MAKRSKKRCEELPILHPDAAGIDVGASELFVAVSADRESTSVYWIPVYQILESRGLEVCLILSPAMLQRYHNRLRVCAVIIG
jgi:hypothetical protein